MGWDNSAGIGGQVVQKCDIAQVDLITHGVEKFRCAEEKRRSGTYGQVDLPVLKGVVAGKINGELLNGTELEIRGGIGG